MALLTESNSFAQLCISKKLDLKASFLSKLFPNNTILLTKIKNIVGYINDVIYFLIFGLLDSCLKEIIINGIVDTDTQYASILLLKLK